MLELEGVTVAYDDLVAVDDLSLSVADGELCCLLGPSGSGKSTVLRAIAGFETPTEGQIRLGGVDVTDRPPSERDCSMVFQDWALFPHKSVLANVAFGPKMAGVGRERRRERARDRLALVEMADYEDATPDQLSGGQRQRVALARSLAVEPDLLLLDEPLSSLDRQLRETMQLELTRIHDEVETTMLYVTHDQDEAFTLGDRMGVMDAGRLVQVDAPSTVYDDPVDRFVESFLGTTNLLDCRVAAVDGGGAVLDTPVGGEVRAPVGADGLAVGDSVTVSLRPERLSVAVRESAPAAVEDGGTATDDVVLTGTVTETIARGAQVRVRLSVGETTLFVERPVGEFHGEPGDPVTVRWAPEEALYFDAAGERCR